MNMEKQILRSADFIQLKGLRNAYINFSETLTAIMGTNGSGKTTVIHALACAFSPENTKLIKYNFSYFFAPNTDSLWSGSNFKLAFDKTDDNGKTVRIEKNYSKSSDRWTPRYDNQPKRNVYYIGIESCLPEIEKSYSSGRINYKSTPLTQKNDIKINAKAAYILNKEYDCLFDNKFRDKHLIGVKLTTGVKYSSLSMGTGEQRVFKILNILYNAEAYSLVLIDEIDLLLHISSLRKLIKSIYDIAKSKHIQVVFTTHSLEMMNMYDYVSVQYLYNQRDEATLVYNRITSDLIYDLTGERNKKYTVYCEDTFAQSIIEATIRKENMYSQISVVTFGAIDNSFTLAASWAITNNDDINNYLIMLDGDKYNEINEKEEQIKKKITGTENNIEEKRRKALSVITQFSLPIDTSPERFLYSLIINNMPHDSEIYKAAQDLKAVNDSHEWFSNISKNIEMPINMLVSEIVNKVYLTEGFQQYCGQLLIWLNQIKAKESANYQELTVSSL